jgi:hypothetical protein
MDEELRRAALPYGQLFKVGRCAPPLREDFAVVLFHGVNIDLRRRRVCTLALWNEERLAKDWPQVFAHGA